MGEGIKSRAQLRGTGGQRAVAFSGSVLKCFPHPGHVCAAGGARRATRGHRARQALALPLCKACHRAVGLSPLHEVLPFPGV